MSLGDRFKNFFSGKIKPDHILSKEEEEEAERKDMIEGVGELSEKTVKEIMVPRIDVDFIKSDASLEDVYQLIAEHGYSRYPVYDGTLDNVTGVLYVKDMLRPDIEKNFRIDQIMRTPYFVPESKHLDDLLRDFKLKHVHIALVVDEYGGVSGIVCMEDILEVIVGEIQDEFDEEEEEEIRLLEDGSYLCDARTDIDDINEELGLAIPEDDFETLGGYVFELFGRIPEKGDKISDEIAEFTIKEIDGHKIDSILISKKKN